MSKNKSSSSRYSLYEEIGIYFNPNGSFNKDAFVAVLKDHILEIREKAVSEKAFPAAYKNWLSDYIRQITDFLNDKGLTLGSIELLKTAVDTSIEMSIDSMLLPSTTIRTVLNEIDLPDRKKNPDDKRTLILQAALQVFGEEGYYAATIDHIASVSGIGKGTVYRFFKSKEELFEQLIKEEYDKIVDLIGGTFESSGDVLAGIQKMIESWIKYINDNPMVYRLIKIEQSMQFLETSKTTYYQYVTDNLPLFKAKVVALNREERLKSTNLYSVFYGIMGFMDGVVQKWIYRGMDYPLTDEIPVILETIFNGFVGETATRTKFFEP